MFFKCEICLKECKGKNGLAAHKYRAHNSEYINPNRGKKRNSAAWNKGLTKETSESIRKASVALKKTNQELGSQSYKIGVPRSKETRDKISKTLREKEPSVFHHPSRKNLKYIDSNGNEVTLQSSYELQLAELLDSMGVKWTRPKAMFYHDKNNIKRRYFADFLLTDFDIFLDPKNDYLIPRDQDKIEAASVENNCTIYILSKLDITENHIRSLMMAAFRPTS